MTTGGSDALECLLRRVGIADTEFTTDAGAGRVHLYAGGDGTNSFMAGGTLSAATTLWATATQLAKYDVTLLSCEGSTSEFLAMKPQARSTTSPTTPTRAAACSCRTCTTSGCEKSPMFAGTATYIGYRHAPRRQRLGRAEPDHQPDVPQGDGAGAVARRAGRHGQPDARDDLGRRRWSTRSRR